MDGILIINKPKGYTSHDIVAIVKKMCGQKVGHTGTLDPNATGVLPLLIGKGTLMSKYLINHDKEYEAVLKLGIKTDTADIEGNIILKEEVKKESITNEKINQVFKSMIGKQKQIPPMYSAIKINGRKLYEYARRGESIELNPRDIEIYSLNLINYNETNNEIKFKVKCSKGTYIRTLCEDIAGRLDSIGFMKELNRTKVGDFSIDDAIDFETLSKINIENYIIKIEKFFKDKPNIILSDKELRLFLNGVKLNMPNIKDGIYKVYSDSIFIGIGNVNNNKLKRDIII